MIATKHCTACDQTKPVTAFAKDASRRDNCQRRCKACERAYKASRKDHISEQGKAWYLANRERKREYNRQAYLARQAGRQRDPVATAD